MDCETALLDGASDKRSCRGNLQAKLTAQGEAEMVSSMAHVYRCSHHEWGAACGTGPPVVSLDSRQRGVVQRDTPGGLCVRVVVCWVGGVGGWGGGGSECRNGVCLCV